MTAAEPFRAGILFQALPDVHYFSAQARLRAPGSRLPARDETLTDYLARLEADELCVHQPLVTSFSLWNAVRLQLEKLFHELGHPLLPVQAVAHVGSFGGPFAFKQTGCASIVWVIDGALQVQMGRRRVTAEAGETLFVPAGSEPARVGGRGLLLRVDLPPTQGSADDIIWSACATLVSHQLPSTGPTPYATAKKGRTLAPPHQQLTRVLAKVCASEELEDTLRIEWLRRLSSCGLEPMPAARTGEPDESTPLELLPGSEILRMPLGHERALWAVHGHVMSAHENPLTRAALETLRSKQGSSFSELLKKAARKSEREELRELLTNLWQVRALRSREERPL